MKKVDQVILSLKVQFFFTARWLAHWLSGDCLKKVVVFGGNNSIGGKNHKSETPASLRQLWYNYRFYYLGEKELA